MTATPRPGSSAPTGPLSMTGFGRAERRTDGLSVRVEARSVNARGLKITLRTPAILEPHQAQLEAAVRARCERGTVAVSIEVDRAEARAPARIDEAVLAEYIRQVASARQAAGDAGPWTLDPGQLVRLPGVVAEHVDSELSDADAGQVMYALDAALDGLLAMRAAEGAAVDATLRALLDHIAAQAAVVAERVPAATAEHQARMRERLETLLAGAHPVSDEMLAREIAVLVEKTDVAEELARLESHIAQTRDALAGGEPCGRRLEFLAQEMGREANTIGAKSTDQVIRDAGIELRLAVDRIKEQAANVE